MYKREKKSWLKHLDFTILDIVCLEASLVIAYLLRFGWYMPYAREPYERLAVIVVLIDICVVFFFEPYNGILRRGHFTPEDAQREKPFGYDFAYDSRICQRSAA